MMRVLHLVGTQADKIISVAVTNICTQLEKFLYATTKRSECGQNRGTNISIKKPMRNVILTLILLTWRIW